MLISLSRYSIFFPSSVTFQDFKRARERERVKNGIIMMLWNGVHNFPIVIFSITQESL